MAAATAAASSATVRYAPEDPSLPKPWKGLVDGKTGFLYFWNPETNVTQYERPFASSSTSSAPSNNAPGSSFQNVCKSHDEGRHDGSAKFAADPGANQVPHICSRRNRKFYHPIFTDPLPIWLSMSSSLLHFIGVK